MKDVGFKQLAGYLFEVFSLLPNQRQGKNIS